MMTANGLPLARRHSTVFCFHPTDCIPRAIFSSPFTRLKFEAQAEYEMSTTYPPRPLHLLGMSLPFFSASRSSFFVIPLLHFVSAVYALEKRVATGAAATATGSTKLSAAEFELLTISKTPTRIIEARRTRDLILTFSFTSILSATYREWSHEVGLVTRLDVALGQRPQRLMCGKPMDFR